MYQRTGFLIVVFALSPWRPLQAQQQSTYVTPVEMKGQFLRGSIAVAEHGNDGMIGMNVKSTEAGYRVENVTAGGPAASSGILPGDVILSVDGKSVKGLAVADTLNPITQKKEGDFVALTFIRNSDTKTASIPVVLRKKFLQNDAAWQKEGTLPPAVGQSIFNGKGQIMVALFQSEQHPNHAFIQLSIYSKDAPSFVADDLKFFVLDGTGQQLRHVSLDEIKYGIQLAVAQNWKGGNYPPPPPPSQPRQYTISGVQNGNYTITNLGGGMGSISGTSNSTYTVTQQPDYNQLGYSLGLAIRKYRDTKSNQRLLEQGKEAIASWEGPYFKSQSPILPGETRNGEIMYWTGTDRRPQPPFRVVLFLTDPGTQKEELITFAFGPGAENIRKEMATQRAEYPKMDAPNINAEPLRILQPQVAASTRIIVRFASAPAGAEVDVDGVYWGTTPTAEMTRLPAGTHTILVKKVGYKPWERKIELGPGDDRTVNAELEVDNAKARISGLN